METVSTLVLVAFLFCALQILRSFWPPAFKCGLLHLLGRSPRNTLSTRRPTGKKTLQSTKAASDSHEVASLLTTLIQEDGAGSWPPRANHRHSTWPEALRPYKEIYLELAPSLPQSSPSLDHDVNMTRIKNFRSRYQDMLRERVDLSRVTKLLEAAESGQWDVCPRDVYNAFYCCIGNSRHAYRWATIPVVSVAQLEQTIDIPEELDQPWKHLQRHFRCPSDSGNNMSNLVLNFDDQVGEEHILKINTGMPESIVSAEAKFVRVFYEVERLGLSVYHDIVLAIITHSHGDKVACARHVSSISAQLRPVFGSFYDAFHDKAIPLSIWLSRVQGFFAWGAGHMDGVTGEWHKFDGLSGNQVFLFQVLDAFLGLEQYLSPRDQERNVPMRQRAFCKAVEKHSFRALLDESQDKHDVHIRREFDAIIKRLRLFRTTHRFRAKIYLSQPAPERLPMTAGKSLLKSNMDDSLEFLDQFMVRRLGQTV